MWKLLINHWLSDFGQVCNIRKTEILPEDFLSIHVYIILQVYLGTSLIYFETWVNIVAFRKSVQYIYFILIPLAQC